MKHSLIILIIILIFAACREDEIIIPAEYEPISDTSGASNGIIGFYLLNEGNMGSNKCTLDFMDYTAGLFARNIFAERNPEVIKELGDVGNDLGIYGSKLYVVVNCSHKVEVLDARTAVRIGQVDIPNCRYIKFYNGKAYVSSYVGPVEVNPDAPRGAVYEIDTLTLAIKRKVTVGYQPEEMEIMDGYMYVANSGGYRAPEYDNTLSVIQMIDFKQTQKIPVDINLKHVRKDNYNQLWVTSQGDHKKRPARLLVLRKKTDANQMEVIDTVPVAVSDFALRGDSLYFISSQWSDITQKNSVAYGIVNVRTHKVIANNFITDGTEREIAVPYSIAVHPVTGDILITDAKNYVSSGTLYCFNSKGKKKWSVRTGDIPASITFLSK